MFLLSILVCLKRSKKNTSKKKALKYLFCCETGLSLKLESAQEKKKYNEEKNVL